MFINFRVFERLLFFFDVATEIEPKRFCSGQAFARELKLLIIEESRFTEHVLKPEPRSKFETDVDEEYFRYHADIFMGLCFRGIV